jgi:hypothetical protein
VPWCAICHRFNVRPNIFPGRLDRNRLERLALCVLNCACKENRFIYKIDEHDKNVPSTKSMSLQKHILANENPGSMLYAQKAPFGEYLCLSSQKYMDDLAGKTACHRLAIVFPSPVHGISKQRRSATQPSSESFRYIFQFRGRLLHFCRDCFYPFAFYASTRKQGCGLISNEPFQQQRTSRYANLTHAEVRCDFRNESTNDHRGRVRGEELICGPMQTLCLLGYFFPSIPSESRVP